MSTETMKVQGGEYGFYIINKDDFNPEIHTEYVEVEEPKQKGKKDGSN